MNSSVKKPTQYIERRLNLNGMGSLATNKKLAVGILVEMLIVGGCYSAYSYHFFHGLWYLNSLVVVSTGIFLFCYLDMRIEMIRKKALADIPKITRKLRYYLIHTRNIVTALEKTEQRVPKASKAYIRSLRDALDSKDIKAAIDKLKVNADAEWFKMICNLVYFCKVNGDSESVITQNLARVTSVIEFINLQQGLDNAMMYWTQLFVLFVPLIGIPLIQSFNREMYTAFDNIASADTLESQIMAAGILFFSNVATLFISWVRKNT